MSHSALWSLRGWWQYKQMGSRITFGSRIELHGYYHPVSEWPCSDGLSIGGAGGPPPPPQSKKMCSFKSVQGAGHYVSMGGLMFPTSHGQDPEAILANP